ncbi:hypothetical protein D9756_003804 [Leucocoprinus leucothites]|uniref:N-acetyltransferase domain-containing protein n=1 Tax=Leucocoprinus leucothites TaxID=201217 RepID=A0A8H5G0Z8_9AGAR|nr:hypothetical protein D9756_003804 [Leucoagaricus leucothites]
MENKTPRIRTLVTADKKLALFVVGKANLESLAVANQQVYSHPFALGLWMLLSFGFIYIMNWWPTSYRGALGILGYLKTLPAFASIAVPLMFLVDWINRPYFEQRTQDAIKEKDMYDPVKYYSQSPASGFWIFEYGDTFVGFIALDANDAGKTRKGIIRHFYIEEAYRKTGIQEDLLNHALTNAFEKSSVVESIEAVDALGLTPYLHGCYERAGFCLGTEYQSTGFRGWWRYYNIILRRKDWKKSNN